MMIPHWPCEEETGSEGPRNGRGRKRTHLDVVTVTESAELLLSSGVPNVEADGTEVGVEGERVDLDTKGGYREKEVSVRKRRKGRGEKDAPMYFFSNSP